MLKKIILITLIPTILVATPISDKELRQMTKEQLIDLIESQTMEFSNITPTQDNRGRYREIFPFYRWNYLEKKDGTEVKK